MQIKNIVVNGQIREELGDLSELKQSIQEHGILQPVLVDKKNNLIAGHRRIAAAIELGMKEIPARVIEPKGKLSEKKDSVIEIQLIENLQRKDLDPLEESEAYTKYIEGTGSLIVNLAKKIGKTTEYVQRRINLKNLTAESQKALKGKLIELGHALILNQMQLAQQKVALKNIMEYDLTVQNFADQIRWMKKINFGNIKFRPAEETKKQTLLIDSIGKELQPQNNDGGAREEFLESDKFKKDIAEYVESQRQILRKKGIIVYSSEEEIMKKHPGAKAINTWETGFNKIIKGLPGSKTHALVVDLGYTDIERGVFKLTTPKEKEEKTTEKKATPKEKEEAEKTLGLNRREKLKNRISEYKREVQLKSIAELMPETGKQQKIMTLWALLQVSSGTIGIQADAMLKEIGCTRTAGWGDYKNAIKKISELKESVIDSWIHMATTWEFEMLSEPNLKKAAELMKFNPAKHWQIDKKYLEIHTKDQLGKLITEIKLDVEPTGKKKEIIEEVLKEKLKGKVPKAMK